MTTINITEFEGYSEEEFKEFLLAQSTTDFEINIPKEGVLFFSPHNELAWEFAIAAYIGEELSKISDQFDYFSAPIADPGEFTFNIKTKKIEAFSRILHLASGGYGNSELSEPIDLSSEVSSFVENSKPEDVVCGELLETYHEYYKEDEDE